MRQLSFILNCTCSCVSSKIGQIDPSERHQDIIIVPEDIQ